MYNNLWPCVISPGVVPCSFANGHLNGLKAHGIKGTDITVCVSWSLECEGEQIKAFYQGKFVINQ